MLREHFIKARCRANAHQKSLGMKSVAREKRCRRDSMNLLHADEGGMDELDQLLIGQTLEGAGLRNAICYSRPINRVRDQDLSQVGGVDPWN